MLSHFIPQDLTLQGASWGPASHRTRNIICSTSPGEKIYEEALDLVKLSPRQGKKVFEEAGNEGIK